MDGGESFWKVNICMLFCKCSFPSNEILKALSNHIFIHLHASLHQIPHSTTLQPAFRKILLLKGETKLHTGPYMGTDSTSYNNQKEISCANIWKWDTRLLALLPMSFIKCLSWTTATQPSLNCISFCFRTFIILFLPLLYFNLMGVFIKNWSEEQKPCQCYEWGQVSDIIFYQSGRRCLLNLDAGQEANSGWETALGGSGCGEWLLSCRCTSTLQVWHIGPGGQGSVRGENRRSIGAALKNQYTAQWL